MVSFRTIALCSLILLTCDAFRPLCARAQEETDSSFFGKQVRSIEYLADGQIERWKLDAALGIAPGGFLTRSAVKSAIQSLYDTGKFSHIAAQGFPEDGGVRLRFDLRLRYYFNRFDITGDVQLGGRNPWDVIPLPVGEPFTQQRLVDARNSVKKYLEERGYYRAQVEVDTEPLEEIRQINTTFRVTSGSLAALRSVEVRGVPAEKAAEIQTRLRIREGAPYVRDRVRRRLDDLKQDFLDQGYLEATAEFVSEEYRTEDNTVALVLAVTNYGRIRLEVDGFKIESQQLRRLLPILSVGGVDQELLQEGARNLVEHAEERGHPFAEVTFKEEAAEDGVRRIHYRIDAGPRVTVTEVRFDGNRAFTSEELLGVIQIQPSRFLQRSVYSVRRLDEDVDALKALYEAAGFLEARIIPLPEAVKGAEKLRITFLCEEGTRSLVRSVNFSGNRKLESDFLETKIGMRKDGPFSMSLVEQSRQAILAAYNDAGFLQPRVLTSTGEPDGTGTYPVLFRIEEGPQSFVDKVLILGGERTRRSVIARRIRISENEPLSLGRLLETQQALYNTGIFDRVRVGPQNPESTAPHQDVVVRLEEARQVILGYGLGYQEDEGARGTLELTHLNLFGTGRRGDLRVRGSRLEQGLLLSFQQPQLLPIQLDSYVTFSARKKREVSFDARRLNFSTQFGQRLSDHSWALLRYTFSNVFISNLKVSGTELEREDVPRNLSTLSAIYVNDTRDNYLDAERGFFTSTDVSVTTKALGGSSNFASVYTQNHYYKRLPGPLLFGSALRFGAAKPFGGDRDLPLSEKFFAGGGSSLRGFATDRAGPLDPVTNRPLGGNAILILNAEIKVPLLRFVHLAGFYDTGNVFKALGDLRFQDFSHTTGLGLRIKTPFGPIRVDYGFNLNLPDRLKGLRDFKQRQLFVTIGPPF